MVACRDLLVEMFGGMVSWQCFLVIADLSQSLAQKRILECEQWRDVRKRLLLEIMCKQVTE